mmetsp:Transcript_83983/g.181159  ORF Transcript_83983/g.181159 Transcript_83983/m.181159 type:complete len:293 (+) Transcript_83983:207-1085(+)
MINMNLRVMSREVPAAKQELRRKHSCSAEGERNSALHEARREAWWANVDAEGQASDPTLLEDGQEHAADKEKQDMSTDLRCVDVTIAKRHSAQKRSLKLARKRSQMLSNDQLAQLAMTSAGPMSLKSGSSTTISMHGTDPRDPHRMTRSHSQDLSNSLSTVECAELVNRHDLDTFSALSPSQPGKSMVLLHADLKPTTFKAMESAVLGLAMTWNFCLPQRGCCLYHSIILHLKNTLEVMSSRGCQRMLTPQPVLRQCHACNSVDREVHAACTSCLLTKQGRFEGMPVEKTAL